jgi:hypothetical protein
LGYVGKDPKKCTRCGEFKPRSDFSKHAVAKGGVQSTCKPCSSIVARIRNKKNPLRHAEIQRNAKLKAAHGITSSDYQEMLEQQNGKCAICGTTDPGGRMGLCGPVFHVDHCHSSGKIRGLLCHSCNVGLGNFRDSVTALANAIAYLGRSE